MAKGREGQGSVKLRMSNSAKEKAPVKKKQASAGEGRRGWSDVFDKLTYSSGPGDNIYVFG